MDLDRIFVWAGNFYHGYPYLTIGIAVGFALVLFLRPKQTVKTLFVLLLVAAAAYILYLIGDAMFSGIAGKKQMINK
jgi:hypothetical protein